jgi:ankyrin repeat protein
MASAACARELLSRGADPNLTGPRGVSPLVSAIVSADEPSAATDLVEQLIGSGAHLTSDLLFAAAAPRVRQGPLVTALLLRKGLDPNVESAEWGTPLHCAVRAGKPNTVKALLDAGANPTARATGKHIGENKTPLEVAEAIGQRELRETITDLLRSHAATLRDSAPDPTTTH